MQKILISMITAFIGTSALAIDNAGFQQFDNQYNIGWGMSQTQFSNGAGNQTLEQDQSLNVEVEHLLTWEFGLI